MKKISILELKKFIKNFNKNADITLPPVGLGIFATNLFFIQKNIDKSIVLDKINQLPYFKSAQEINGFLNVKLDKNLLKILEFNLPQEKKNFHIEFASLNPTGPAHLGHLRNIIEGDTLVQMLRFFHYNVFSEQLINDQGLQIKNF